VPERTEYDRHVSTQVGEPGEPPPRRRLVRLVVVPLILFAGVSGAAFTLAKAHPARPGAPKGGAGTVQLGDSYRGEVTFGQTCAPCHGEAGKGGVGPRLRQLPISIALVKAQIDNGGGSMPAHLVTGRGERDVLAFVATLIAPPQG
jgi:mono/diheme cytochrome c family protein